MNKTIYLLLFLSILYSSIQTESYRNFSYQSRRAVCIKNTRPRRLQVDIPPNTRDEFGFKLFGKQRKQEYVQRGTNMIVYCPIRIPANKAALLIKANQMHYVIDVRTKKEYNSGHVKKSILMEDLGNYPHKIKFLDGISRKAYILVYCSDGKRSFQAAELLKKRGGFKRIFYVEYGGYHQLRKYL
jgi:rhodanese-related sulfurtransferase